ncbi:MAG: LTA synthase family protein [Bacillota bacterium]|nr:LTA synthase family protein [Bacillota bacterium]MDW7677404.1 LTA synthase family protein [Bacillota bacterium]
MKKNLQLVMPDQSENQLMFIFITTLLVKMMILHRLMQIEQHFWTITIMTAASLAAIFSLIRFLMPIRYMRGYLAVHIILTSLIFINTVYYSHFYTLLPVHSVFLIGQLGGVTDSIAALMRPAYFLYFIDTAILWFLHQRGKLIKNRSTDEKNHVYVLLFLLLTVFLGTAFYQLSQRTEGHLTPANLGMLNYHVVDLVRLFMPTPVNPELAEEAVTALVQEEEERQFSGLLKNRNIIVIQAESLQSFVMEHHLAGQEITPVLNRLAAQDSLYFSRFYEQAGWGNTSDAEFVSHNSFYPSTKTFSYRAYQNNTFYTLPMLLRELGYSTMVFHGNDPEFWNRRQAYPGQGIDRYYSSEDFDMTEVIGMGLSDHELFQQSIEWLKQSPDPFYAFYSTLTSHHPFDMPEEMQYLKMPDEYAGTVLAGYLQSVHYLDRQIGEFIDRLQSEGLYENAAIVIYGDHQGLDMRDEAANDLVSRFIRKPYQEDEMFRVPLLIHIPGSGLHEEVTIAGGQIDFFPTISNLMGKPVKPNQVMGKDLLNIQEGFVAKQIHVSEGSFIDNGKIFIMSPEGIYENSRAWMLQTGEPVPLNECRSGYERALAEIALSEYILQNDLVLVVREIGLEGILDEIRSVLNLE